MKIVNRIFDKIGIRCFNTHVILLVMIIAMCGCQKTTRNVGKTECISDSILEANTCLQDTILASLPSTEVAVYDSLISKGSLNDSQLIDSIFSLSPFINLNQKEFCFVMDYILYCKDEDGSEGIAERLGEAFLNDEFFFLSTVSVYETLNTRQKDRLLSFLRGGVIFYIDTWLSEHDLSAPNVIVDGETRLSMDGLKEIKCRLDSDSLYLRRFTNANELKLYENDEF